MNITTNYNVNNKYQSNICTSNINYKKNIVFNGKDFLSSSINSDINKAIVNVKSNSSNYATLDEIKKIMLLATEKMDNLKKIGANYEKNLKNIFIKGVQNDNNKFFVGKNPNYDENFYNIDTFYEQYKEFSEDEKLLMIRDFANLNNGKYINYWRRNPEKLSFFVNNTMFLPSQMKNFNSETWDAVIESIIKVFEYDQESEVINSIMRYSTDGNARKINFLKPINDLLSETIANLENRKFSQKDYLNNILKIKELINDSSIFSNIDYLEQKSNFDVLLSPLPEGCYISPKILASNLKNFVLNLINEICDYETIQKITNNLKKVHIVSSKDEQNILLWRDDSCNFFNIQEFEGELMGRYMKYALTDSTKRVKLLTYFNTQNPEIERKTFLSTALKPFEFMKKDIKWNLKIGEGVKYLYIEPFKFFGRGEEAELLVHPCKLKINNAECCDKKWILNADILPLESY